MISYEELKAKIAADSKIDSVQLANESVRIPEIHSTYLNMLYDLKPELKRNLRAIRVLRKLKWEYYTGKISQENLDKYKWEPFQLKILKSDVDLYIDADPQIQKMQENIDELEMRIEMIEQFTKMMASRHWTIRNAIEWNKFTNGVI